MTNWKPYLALAVLAWIIGYIIAPVGPIAAPHHLWSSAIAFCAFLGVYWWGLRRGRLGK